MAKVIASTAAHLDYYVDMRLKEWASWSLKIMTNGLGYPSQVSFLNIPEGGGVERSSSTLSNSSCEETEVAMVELNEYRKELATAVRIRYTSRVPKVEAKKYGLSYDQYKKSLQLAKCWLVGALTGKYRG